ncbi:sigma-70 family RNA polymerase sigma factor [Lentzea sp. NPDC034063]|uniref:RNA polymerase sigma factor n=1 Tax=unclassified Lentzea TaxID=2643253 RepID=UPI0033FBDADC
MVDLADVGTGYSDPGDVELVRAVQVARKRSPEQMDAFEAIVRKYRERVLRWCLRHLGDEVNAHDACQDTFMAALAGIRQVKEPHRLRSWLYTIAKRRCIAIINGKRERGILASDMRLEIEEHQRVEQELAELQPFFDRLLHQVIDSFGPAERAHGKVVSSKDKLSGEELAARLGRKTAQDAWRLAGKIRAKISIGLRALALARNGREECGLLDRVLLSEKEWKGEEVFTKYLRNGISFHWHRCRMALLSHARNQCAEQAPACTHCAACARQKDEKVKEYMPAMAPVMAVLPWDEPLPEYEEDEEDELVAKEAGSPPVRRRGKRVLVAGAALLIVAVLVLLFVLPDDQQIAAPPTVPSTVPFRAIAYTSSDNVWLLPGPGEQPKPIGEATANRVRRVAGWSADGRLTAYLTQQEDGVGVAVYEPSTGKSRVEGCAGCSIAFVGSTPVITDATSPTGFSTFPVEGGGAPFTVSGLPAVDPVENVYGNTASRYTFLTRSGSSGQRVYLTNGPERFSLQSPETLYSVGDDGSAKAIYTTADAILDFAFNDDGDRLLVVTPQDNGQVAQLVDPKSGAVLSPVLLVDKPATGGAQGVRLADLGFDNQGTPYAVTMAVGELRWDPNTSPQVEPSSATTHRLSAGAWGASTDPVSTAAGNGWTATLAYDSVMGKVALGVLTFRKEGSAEVKVSAVSVAAVFSAK